MATATEYNDMFDDLRDAVESAHALVLFSAQTGTGIEAIIKAPAIRDDVNAAGLDLANAGRVLVKASDFTLPDNRRIYVSTDAGASYTLRRIAGHSRLANAIVAIDYVSANSGTSG